MIGDLANGVGRAARALRKAPGFTAVTVGTLGLSIGAGAGIFAVVDAVLLNPLPFEDGERLVYIGASAPGTDLEGEFPASSEFYLQYGESDLLEGLSAFNSFTSTLRVDDRVERVRMSVPTPSLFTTLGATPMLGRLPVPEDEDRVAVISHALWTQWFGNDDAILGRTIYASGGNREVIGVMGPEFWFPSDDVLVWIPSPIRAEDVVLGRFGLAGLVARLPPGVERDELVADLRTRASRLPERFGGSAAYARIIAQHQPVVRPLRAQILGDIAGPLWILLGSAGVVLMIAIANVANLFLVRSEDRMRDFAVRRALGANRVRLFGSSIAEAVVVAGLAGTAATAIAWVGLPVLLAAAPPIPRLGQVGMSGATLAFTILASALCALVCGAAPALRSSASELGRLRDGGRGSTAGRRWGRDGLVVVQSALALVLLIGSGLLLRSLQELRGVDPGYDVEDVYTFQVGAEDEPGLTDGPTFARFHESFMERIAELPGVSSVGIVENVPLNEGVANGSFRTEEDADDPDAGSLLSYTWAGGDYWDTMGIDVLEGRVLTPDDHVAGVGNVVLSRRAAEVLWPGESAVGRRILSDSRQAWYTVVGVVEDVLQNDFRGLPDPLLYLPLVGPTPTSWALSSPAYVVKTARAEEVGPEIRALAREIAPSAPMYRTFTMAGLAADSMVQLSFTALALGIASVLALILGAIGLYGVLSYVVTQRTREIGVRMALGAEATRVRRMVVAQGARVVVIGVAVGVAIALGVTRALDGLLYEIEPADITTFLVTSAGMVLVGLLASYVPARRASSVDPVESLKG